MRRKQRFLEKFVPEHVKFAADIMNWEKPTITLLTPSKKAGYGFGKSTRFMMLKEIERNGITVIPEAKIRRMEKHQVVYLAKEQEMAIPADTIVIGEGWQKNDRLLSGLSEFAEQVEIIGDAKRPGRIAEAVGDAFAAAMSERRQ